MPLCCRTYPRKRAGAGSQSVPSSCLTPPAAVMLSATLRRGVHISRSVSSRAQAATDLSYCKALFLGYNDETRCFPYPRPSEEETELLAALD